MIFYQKFNPYLKSILYKRGKIISKKLGLIGISVIVFTYSSSPKKSNDTAALGLLLGSDSSSSSGYTFTEENKKIIYVSSEDNSVQLPYQKVGKKDGKKIIVVHGGPGLSSQYNKQAIADSLAKDHQLIFYDQRYTGNSTSTTVLTPIADNAKISLAKFVDDLESVRKAALGDTTKANLLGHSWGGRLIAEYATHTNYKTKVNSVIFVSSMPLHWTGGNIRTANLVEKMGDYNITNTAGSYNNMFNGLTVASGILTPANPTPLATKKTGYETYSKTYFGEFVKHKFYLSRLDFTFNDVTAKNYAAIFLAPLPLQSTPYKYNAQDGSAGITGLFADGDNKDLTAFPDVPVLIIHGEDDLFPWQYSIGGETDTEQAKVLDLTNFGGAATGKDNTIKQVFEGRKNGGNFPTIDGDKMFGATGVSIYHKLKTQANLADSKITKKKLSNTGHFPSVENPSEFRDTINDFVKNKL